MKLSDRQFATLFLTVVLLFLMVSLMQCSQVRQETFRLCLEKHSPVECWAVMK